MIEHLPDVIVLGDIEFLFGGIALGAGCPKLGRKIIKRRYDETQPSDDEGAEE